MLSFFNKDYFSYLNKTDKNFDRINGRIDRGDYRFLWNTKSPLAAMINEPRIVLIEGVSPKIR